MLERINRPACRISVLLRSINVICLNYTPIAYAQKSAKPLEIFIFAGQSNMDVQAERGARVEQRDFKLSASGLTAWQPSLSGLKSRGISSRLLRAAV